MAKIGIITDSIASLTPELIKEFDIRVIPVPISIDGKSYRDGVDITPDSFWRIFPNIKEVKTGAPALDDYIKVLKDLSKTTDNIICIFVSGALSAITEVGIQASELLKKEKPGLNLEVVDSRTAAGSQAFLVEEAARMAQAGKSLNEIVKVVKDTIPRVKFVTILETLKYLIRGGRAPKKAYMGELFQVKPIIGMLNNTGLVENLGQARGKNKAMVKALDIMEENIDTSRPVKVNAHYTNSIEDGEIFKQMVTKRFNCSVVYFTPYTPVMSAHTGPVIAVSFFS